jgi:mono/diheme cytochrome c family protein
MARCHARAFFFPERGSLSARRPLDEGADLGHAAAMKKLIAPAIALALASTLALAGCPSEPKTEPPPPATPTPPPPPETPTPPAGDPTATAPAAADPKAEAEQVFAQRCSVCHGATGKGDGPGAAALNPKPRDYSDAEWQKSVDDAYLAKVIVEGGAAVGKSPTMIANADLKDKPEVVKELVAKVRSFGAPAQ